MLTVKHVACDGVETIYQCEKIKVIQGRGRFEDGIFLDPVEDGSLPGLGFKDVVHFDQGHSTMGPSFTYVMNANGATVAKYEMSYRGESTQAQAQAIAA